MDLRIGVDFTLNLKNGIAYSMSQTEKNGDKVDCSDLM